MPLAAQTKRLIKEEIDLLNKEERATSGELKEIGLEVKAQVAEALAAHEKLVQELHYKQKELGWHLVGLRILWLALVGGGILGVWYAFSNFQNYIDSRIGLRLANSDRLALASSMAYERNWRAALIEFDTALDDYKKGAFATGPEYRTFLFQSLIWVMANVQERESDGSWTGQNQWRELMSDRAFQREFILSSQYEHDAEINHNLGMCILEFDETSETVRKARPCFERALANSRNNSDRAPRDVILAMLDLIEGQQTEALIQLQMAEVNDPEGHNMKENAKNIEEFIKSPLYQTLDNVATRLHVNLRQSLTDLCQRITSSSQARDRSGH